MVHSYGRTQSETQTDTLRLPSLTDLRKVHNMRRIISMATTTAATMMMTDYLALAVVLATMLAMSIDNVTGALLMIALITYLAPAITSESQCRT